MTNELKLNENYKKERSKIYYGDEIFDIKQLLERSTSLFGGKPAFKYKKSIKDSTVITKTYNNLKSDVDALGTNLINMGLEGKRVAFISPNRYEWCVTYFAVTTGNMVAVPLDRSLPDNEIESLIIRSNADCVVFDIKYLNVFQKLQIENTSNLQYYICMDYASELNNILSFQKLIEKGNTLLSEGDTKHANTIIDREKMSVMLFTSGTTAISKAVMLSQKNICTNINDLCSIAKIDENDSLLSFLPLHHTLECTVTFLFGLSRGITICFCDGLKYIAKNLEDYKITVLLTVPLMLETMYKKIMKGIESQGKTGLIKLMTKLCNFLLIFKIDIRKKVFKSILNKLGGHLRLVVYGAAPMDADIVLGLTHFGIDLIQGYGLTETSPVLCAENDKFKKPGSCGFPLNHITVAVDNPNEKGIGEIIAKGDSVMLGYYENEEATKEVLKDGWFYTGDLGYIDKNGYVYITGRKKNVIVLKNGKNIFPEELETLINRLPYVAESIVYGKPGRDNDLDLCTKIVYNEEIMQEMFPGASKEQYYNTIQTEIKEINKTMPPYKYIRETKITDIPLIKTTTQKIKRHEEIKLALSEPSEL